MYCSYPRLDALRFYRNIQIGLERTKAILHVPWHQVIYHHLLKRIPVNEWHIHQNFRAWTRKILRHRMLLQHSIRWKKSRHVRQNCCYFALCHLRESKKISHKCGYLHRRKPNGSRTTLLSTFANRWRPLLM